MIHLSPDRIRMCNIRSLKFPEIASERFDPTTSGGRVGSISSRNVVYITSTSPMVTRYALLIGFSVPFAAFAQPQLPGFAVSDTITMPCPQDTTVNILTYVDWEAYQTVDDTWNGPRDTTVCVDLAHVIGIGVHPRIPVDQIDAARPVFLRARFDDDTVLPLTSDNQYTFSFSAFINTLFETGDCPGGPCTGVQAAVRIPSADGTGTDLRWYEAAWQEDPWSAFPFALCVPTEKFAVNELREYILSFKISNPQPGQFIQYFWSDVIDQDLFGSLVRLTPDILPQYNMGPQSYSFEGWGWQNFLVMHADTTYPDGNHIFNLDFSPVPNQAVQTEVTVNLMPYTGFNFQPFTQLRGGLVEGNDTLRHPLTVVNNGADLCLGWEIVELIWNGGDRYVHHDGHLEFGGRNSCFMFQPGSTLEVAPGSTFQYGLNGRGMLALINGSRLRIGTGGELVMHGTLVIKEAPGVIEAQDWQLTLGPGERLSFAPGSRIHNAFSIDGRMKLIVTLDGGSIDISGLGPEDRPKVVVIELPKEEWTDLRVLGNPAHDELVLTFSVREEGTVGLRAIDALGRRVADRVVTVLPGENRLSLPLHGMRQGAYILELTFGQERRVLRFVKE